MAFNGQKRTDQEEEDMEILINILIVISNTSLDMLRVQTLEADSPEQNPSLTSFKARQHSDTTKQGVKHSRFDSDGRDVLWRIVGVRLVSHTSSST